MSEAKKLQVDVSKPTDFEISMLVIDRDTAQFRMGAIDELLNKVGKARGFSEAMKSDRAVQPKAEVSEAPFNARKYRAAKGEKLGEYELCFKNDNTADDWQHCYNILKQNNATIKNHFTEPSWSHYYWLYEKNDDRLYRKARSTS
jgi:hypothetical protein